MKPVKHREQRLVSCLILTILSAIVLSGCASDPDFDRHSLSRLWLSADRQQIFFDATVTSAYPEDAPEAEAVRRAWIAEWLRLRKFCQDGFTVMERRAIGREEYNPMRHDLRYRIECSHTTT